MGLADRFTDRLDMNSVVRMRLRRKGIEARARVIRAEGWTGRHDSGAQTFNLRELVLKVYPPVGEPYEVAYDGGVAARISGGYCTTGADVPVRIDPKRQERVVVDIERAKAEQQSLMDGLEQMTASYEDKLREQEPTGIDEDLEALAELDKRHPG